MKYASVGSGVVFGIDEESKLFQCELPCKSGDDWKEIDFCLSVEQVEATAGEIVGTSFTGSIFKKAT